jgi:bacterioferritin-associated ferredoxin
MRDYPSVTHRLTLTHDLTHGVKPCSRKCLAAVRESVSQVSKSIRIENQCIRCVRSARAHMYAHARVRTHMCKGLETDSSDSQTHGPRRRRRRRPMALRRGANDAKASRLEVRL